MDINSVVTREEYNNMRNLNYDQFCGYLMKLVKLCVEESLRSLPSVMVHLSSQAAYLKSLSDKFYADNKDLSEHRGIVTKVIEKMEAMNPGETYEEVLKLAAEEARKIVSNIPEETSFGPRNLKQFDSHLRRL